jgi:uncharacterized protein with ParB-like and HNH nuclease domain
MVTSVNNFPISVIFNIDSNVVYAVPPYQREYKWAKIHWEKLFDDILDNNAGYFLGSIICINPKEAVEKPQMEIVDGQQRLLTLSLLFSAIYHALEYQKNLLDEDQKNELFNLKKKLVLKTGVEQIRVIPQIQNNNLNDYRALLSNIGIISSYDAPPYAGNRKIYKAFYYFKDRVEKLANGNGNNLLVIMELLDKISKASMVTIQVSSHSDAYILFESLNNRGMPLTAIDLIKNKLLARLGDIEPKNIDHHYENWNKLLSYFGDEYDIQERFFRHYYNAFREELKAIYQVPVAKKSNLIMIYEKLIDKDANEFLQKIMVAGKLYAKLLSHHSEHALSHLEKALKDLERIQGAPSYLLLLYLLARRKDLNLNEKHLEKIVQLFVRFFVRRNLTDKPPTRDLTRLFMEIIGRLSGTNGEDSVAAIQNKLIEVSADDNLFRSKLEGPIYDDNKWVTRFVLCNLAEQGMTYEIWRDLWEVKNKQFVWTIEHIFPQGERIPQDWVDMIAGGDEKQAKDYQQTYVHKLGNLTITGYNPTLSNRSFDEKRNRKDKKGNYVGYKNGLKLNEDLVGCENWTVQKIEARTVKLVDKCMDLFKWV